MSLESRKLIALKKIRGAGVRSQKEFLYMSAADMVYSIPEIEPDELHTLCELQDSIRNNKLFEFLCEKGDEID